METASSELPFNEANAVAYWLRQEGFEPSDTTVWELRNGYLSFEVKFEDGEKPADRQREQYNEFLEQSSYLTVHEIGPQIWPRNLWKAVDLPPLSGECSHSDCSDEVEEYVIFQTIGQVRTYCAHHADRARGHFFEDGL